MTVSSENTSASASRARWPRQPAQATVVMLVEDEDSVRRVAGEILQSAGYTVLTAKNGKEALQLAQRKAIEITVLIADVVMPEMSGPELARQLLREHPRLKTIFISGYPENVIPGKQIVNACYLRKPFSVEGLMRAVAEAEKSTLCDL